MTQYVKILSFLLALLSICSCLFAAGCDDLSKGEKDEEQETAVYEKFEVQFGAAQVYNGFKTKEELVQAYESVQNDENAQSKCTVRVNHYSSVDNSVIAEIFGDEYEEVPEVYKEPYDYYHVYENSADLDFEILERIAEIKDVKTIVISFVNQRELPQDDA